MVEACLDRKAEHSIDGRWVDTKRYGENDDADFGHMHDGQAGPRVGGAAPRHTGNGGFASSGNPGTIEWFSQMAGTTNPEYLNMQYCVSCSFPSAKCGALIGRRGDKITEVQRATGADVVISKKELNEAPDAHRTVTITGPLMSIYGAHLMLMRFYHEDEAQHQRSMQDRGGDNHVQQLQSQLQQLTEELAVAQGGRRGGPPPRGPPRGPVRR